MKRVIQYSDSVTLGARWSIVRLARGKEKRKICHREEREADIAGKSAIVQQHVVNALVHSYTVAA